MRALISNRAPLWILLGGLLGAFCFLLLFWVDAPYEAMVEAANAGVDPLSITVWRFDNMLFGIPWVVAGMAGGAIVWTIARFIGSARRSPRRTLVVGRRRWMATTTDRSFRGPFRPSILWLLERSPNYRTWRGGPLPLAFDPKGEEVISWYRSGFLWRRGYVVLTTSSLSYRLEHEWVRVGLDEIVSAERAPSNAAAVGIHCIDGRTHEVHVPGRTGAFDLALLIGSGVGFLSRRKRRQGLFLASAASASRSSDTPGGPRLPVDAIFRRRFARALAWFAHSPHYVSVVGGGLSPLAFDPKGEKVVGWYRNPAPFEGQDLVLTTVSLNHRWRGEWVRVAWDELVAQDSPSQMKTLDTLVVREASGREHELALGGTGDAFAFRNLVLQAVHARWLRKRRAELANGPG